MTLLKTQDMEPMPAPVMDRDDPLLAAVAAYFNEYGWPARRSRVLVALSGGMDSVSLLGILHVLAPEHEWRLGAAHVNYHLRGDDSDGDESFCREWCERLAIPLHVHHAHHPTDRSVNVQEWARHERYALFDRLMEFEGYDRVAIGHTRDDRAESVAAAVIEARGTFALSGIPPIRDRVIRPLIGVTRGDVQGFVARNDLTYREDASNASLNYLRNRIRHEHLPHWAESNPSIRQGLARLSGQLWRQETYLFHEAERIIREATIDSGDRYLSLNAGTLSPADPALDPFLLRVMLRSAGVSVIPTSDTVERFTELRLERPSGQVEQGDLVIERSQGVITVSGRSDTQHVMAYTVTVQPGETVEMGPLSITATVGPTRTAAECDDRSEAMLDWNCLHLPLVIRGWQRGDRYQPIGMSGHKTLADLFADRGVPRGERSSALVLTDSLGVIWPIGHPIADRAKLTPETESVLHVKVSRQ
ncbi:MAG: tRNA lysidine(34) synthetase TilS [candidate division Zixibacteria bacterium]|nr:tRNA lysidine(34) synthetase TilS [candidate division Zixibacteria bacterium]